ncbi:MAG: preprotein translocase subunit SecY, partial [Planctomycetota bacterium]|nr:preprotein translocase subunit SecY [Planctomycetota bacterium]
MFESFANIFRIPELRKRLFMTFILLVVYRVGWNIPMPGIDPSKLRALQEAGSDNALISFLNIIS